MKLSEMISREKEWYLVIRWESDGNSVTAEDGAGVTAVGDDNFVRGEDRDDSSGSNGVAVRSLELAPAVESLVTLAPAKDLIVHASETVLHHQFPLKIIFVPIHNLFIHNLM